MVTTSHVGDNDHPASSSIPYLPPVRHWDLPEAEPAPPGGTFSREYSPERLAAIHEDESCFISAEPQRQAKPPGHDEGHYEGDDYHDEEEPDHGTLALSGQRELPDQIAERRMRFLKDAVPRMRAKEAAKLAEEAVKKEKEKWQAEEAEKKQAEARAAAEERRRANPLLARIEDARCPNGVESWEFDQLRGVLLSAMKPNQGGNSIDPVLRCAISNADRDGTANSDGALNTYLKMKAAYDALLGDAIPVSIRNAAERFLNNQAYDQRTNPTAEADWAVYTERFEQRMRDPLQSLTTGLRGLDAALGGGLRGLAFLGGASAKGKTSLALQIGLSALSSHPNLAVLYIMLDDIPCEGMYDMLRTAEMGLPLEVIKEAVKKNDEAMRGRLNEASRRLSERGLGRLRVVDRMGLPPGGVTARWLYGLRSDLARETGAEQVLIVLDDLQNLPVSADQAEAETADRDRLQLLKFVRDWTRTVAHPGGDPVLAISQIPKGQGETGLVTTDLKGDAALGYGASTVMFLEPVPNATVRGTEVPELLRVTKARGGMAGAQIHLIFDHPLHRFREKDPVVGEGRGSPARVPSEHGGNKKLNVFAGKNKKGKR